MRLVTALLIGAIFGSGIAISGMMNPAKVLNFFDIAGSWDPSLALVMLGALSVAIPGYWLVLRRGQPRLATEFQLPDTKRIDAKLIGGSALFGIGWGIAGFCPGGALPGLGTGRPEVVIYLLSLIAGIFIAHALQHRHSAKGAA